jgi:hypothetical protein
MAFFVLGNVVEKEKPLRMENPYGFFMSQAGDFLESSRNHLCALFLGRKP